MLHVLGYLAVRGGIGLVHVHERLGLLKVWVQRVARSMITMSEAFNLWTASGMSLALSVQYGANRIQRGI